MVTYMNMKKRNCCVDTSSKKDVLPEVGMAKPPIRLINNIQLIRCIKMFLVRVKTIYKLTKKKRVEKGVPAIRGNVPMNTVLLMKI